MHKDLHFCLDKTFTVHKLSNHGITNQEIFCWQCFNILSDNEDLIRKLLVTNEAQLHILGYVNKHNFRY